MSTYYYVVCEDCRKEYLARSRTAGTVQRYETLPLWREKNQKKFEYQDDPIQPTKLEIFLWRHQGHRLRFVSEHWPGFEEGEPYQDEFE